MVPTTAGGLAGWISTVVLGGTLWAQMRKTKVDESAHATARWQALLDQHVNDIKELREDSRLVREELRTERAAAKAEREENGKLRQRLSQAEATIDELRNEIEGLKRQIAQVGQSAVMMIGDGKPRSDVMTRALERIESEETKP